MLQLNTIRSQPGAHRKNKRLGRGTGSGHGKTAGKGHKGQLARSGGVARPGFEGGQTPLYRRLPKVGFKNTFRATTYVLNVGDFSRKSFKGLKEITLPLLIENNIIKSGAYTRLSILGDGELKQALTVKAHHFSESAQKKIEAAGGKIELVKMPGEGRRGKLKKRSRQS